MTRILFGDGQQRVSACRANDGLWTTQERLQADGSWAVERVHGVDHLNPIVLALNGLVWPKGVRDALNEMLP